MALNAGNIKIRPMNVTWGEDKAQVSTVRCRADVSSDLNNDYFLLYSALNATRYYVWMNVGGAGVDPAVPGHTGIEVTFAANSSGTAVASAIASAVGAEADFSATSSGVVATITNAADGYCANPREGVGTGFAFTVTTQGDLEEEVGFIDGSIETTLSKDFVDVTAHQRGTEKLDSISTGTVVEMSMTFKETTQSRLRRMLRGVGGSYIPATADGEEVFGLGQYKNFTNASAYSSRMVLHPQDRLASDTSEDICVWKAFVIPESISFSGEEILTFPVTISVFPDLTKPEQIQHFCEGDWTQFV